MWAGTAQSVWVGRSGDRIPVEARFSAPVETDPGSHSACYTMGTASFLAVKRPGRGVDHPPPSSPEVKERVELYLYSPFGLVLERTLPLPLPHSVVACFVWFSQCNAAISLPGRNCLWRRNSRGLTMFETTNEVRDSLPYCFILQSTDNAALNMAM